MRHQRRARGWSNGHPASLKIVQPTATGFARVQMSTEVRVDPSAETLVQAAASRVGRRSWWYRRRRQRRRSLRRGRSSWRGGRSWRKGRHARVWWRRNHWWRRWRWHWRRWIARRAGPNVFVIVRVTAGSTAVVAHQLLDAAKSCALCLALVRSLCRRDLGCGPRLVLELQQLPIGVLHEVLFVAYGTETRVESILAAANSRARVFCGCRRIRLQAHKSRFARHARTCCPVVRRIDGVQWSGRWQRWRECRGCWRGRRGR